MFIFVALVIVTSCQVIVPVNVIDGGIVELGDQVKMIIPENSVVSGDVSVPITIRQTAEVPIFEKGIMASSVYSFEPDGLQFEEPVEVEFKVNLSVPDYKAARLMTFDEEEGEWIPVGNQKGLLLSKPGDILKAKINHFSKYTVSLEDNVTWFFYSYLYNNPIFLSINYNMDSSFDPIFEKAIIFNQDASFECRLFDKNHDVKETYSGNWWFEDALFYGILGKLETSYTFPWTSFFVKVDESIVNLKFIIDEPYDNQSFRVTEIWSQGMFPDAKTELDNLETFDYSSFEFLFGHYVTAGEAGNISEYNLD